MKTVRNVACFFLLVLCSLSLLGCGKEADESKPVDEVKAEAEDINAEQLRSMAMEYKEAILAKQAEIKKLVGKLKDIPPAELTGTEAKQIRAELEELNSSALKLKQQFTVYYRKIAAKGGDTSGLKP